MKKRFFSHDENALSDPKIMSMMSVYGFEGYGRFWALVELLRREDSYKINMNKRTFYVSIAHYLRWNDQDAKQFIDDCIREFELFNSDGEYFWSESLNNRMMMMEQKSEARSNAANARWSKKQQEQTQEALEQVEPEQDKPKPEKPIRKKNATVAQYDEIVIELTDLLIAEIKNNNPQAKHPSNLDSWRNDMRLLIQDGYDRDQVEKVIKWCQADEFWKSNILSAKKLREKVGTLVLQMNRGMENGRVATNQKRPKIEVGRFEEFNHSDVSPERIEEIRGSARKVEELLRMRKVQG